jgi:transposase InsO family protein
MKFVHTSLWHLGNDVCYAEIKDTFHFRNLGRKLTNFIAACDLCQRIKQITRAYDVAERHHLQKRPGELCATDMYGSLPTQRGNVRYIFVCYDVFPKYVKLYYLKSATTKACLNKLLCYCFVNVIKPKIILSNNGSQFRSPVWLKILKENDVTVRFSPIRHPDSNPQWKSYETAVEILQNLLSWQSEKNGQNCFLTSRNG